MKSLQLHRVPCQWKDSVIVPVPEIQAPNSLTDCRPVALTSLLMKTFEKMIKEEILGATIHTIIQNWIHSNVLTGQAGR